MWQLGRLAMISDTGADRQRGRQITGLISMESTGKLIGPALGGFVAVADIRAPFIIHGVLSLLSIIPSFKLIKESRPEPRSARDPVSNRGAPKTFWGSGMLNFSSIVLFTAQFFAALTRGSLWSGSVNLYAVYAYDVGAKTLGVLATVTGAVGIPITFSAGHLMDRFGRKATLVPGFTLLGLGLFFMATTAFWHLSFSAFVIALFWVQAAQNLTGGSMQTLASDLAPAESRGKFFGVWKLVGEIATALSPIIFALNSEYLGFPASFIFFGATGLGSALLIGTQVKETLRKEPTVLEPMPLTEAEPSQAAQKIIP